VKEVGKAWTWWRRRSGRRSSVVSTAPAWRRNETPASWRRSEALARRRSEAPVWRRTWMMRRRERGGGWMRRRSGRQQVWGNDKVRV
jgi:hypothetical protein